MNTKQLEVRLKRTIQAPPEQVYRAWLDPEVIRIWLAPGGFEVKRAEIDGRVGGHLRIWHSHSGADAGGFDCELIELVPNQLIVFRWGFVGPDRENGPCFDSRLTISLRELPGERTELILLHEQLDGLAAALPEVAANVSVGWEMVLDKLVSLSDTGGLPGDPV